MTTSPDLPMDENDRCWAFSPEMERCEGYAGHDGSHFINRAWTHEECWVPSKGAAPAPIPQPPLWTAKVDAGDTEHLTPGPNPNEMCICDHPRRSHSNGVGVCDVCDCRGFIG